MASFATMTLEKLPILSVDLETTGLRPAQDRVLQIGMLDPFEPQSAQQYFVKADIAIPASSTEIHGISEEKFWLVLRVLQFYSYIVAEFNT